MCWRLWPSLSNMLCAGEKPREVLRELAAGRLARAQEGACQALCVGATKMCVPVHVCWISYTMETGGVLAETQLRA